MRFQLFNREIEIRSPIYDPEAPELPWNRVVWIDLYQGGYSWFRAPFMLLIWALIGPCRLVDWITARLMRQPGRVAIWGLPSRFLLHAFYLAWTFPRTTTVFVEFIDGEEPQIEIKTPVY